MIREISRVIVNHLSPVLLGCKPAALFTLRTVDACTCLPALLPAGLSFTVLRKSGNGFLVFVFREEKIEKILRDKNAGTVLAGLGYPAGTSVPASLRYFKKQLSRGEFPHEVGLFLGYPVDDVLGFVKYRGQNYKLCGYWKVYGDVEQARRRFRQFDLCRTHVRAALA
jgi:hypothetical protein